MKFWLGFGFLIFITSCQRNPELPFVCGYEVGEAACTDGKDNDCDGRIDYNDRDCAFSAYSGGEKRFDFEPRFSEEVGSLLCNDNIDNDDD